ncbi:MAG: tRNA (adenosine(37)-N6)-threonylcarbamoyltransferase complex dimerization subunit type 1 TsaB [Pseudohongiellaceae bacterium]
MNTILTIDTSSANCAVALLHDSVLIERVSEAERQSAQRVLPMISELLSEAELALGQIDLIAVVAGPGSFTGVRIGIAVAQGLSLSSSIPVVPLSSLALLAMASVIQNRIDRVLICEKARDEEIYFAAYQKSTTSGVELIGREQVARIADLDVLPVALQTLSWCIAGDGWGNKQAILRQLGCSAAAEPCASCINNELIAEFGRLRFQSGEAVDGAGLRPNYVKEQLDYT